MALHPREGALIDWDDRPPGWRPRAAPANPEPEQRRTDLRWVRSRSGRNAVVGPVGIVKVGAVLEAFDTKAQVHHVLKVTHLGRTWRPGKGNPLMVYGYGYDI